MDDGVSNATVIFLPKSVLPIPGVCTCPKPGHALHVSTFISYNESVVTLKLVGMINFLFCIFVPVLFNMKSFGLIPSKVSLKADPPNICLTPELAEYIC